VVQHKLIRDDAHRVHPVPVRRVLTWRAVFLGHGANERPWKVDLGEALPHEHEGEGEEERG
jgi:hypothetical protein